MLFRTSVKLVNWEAPRDAYPALELRGQPYQTSNVKRDGGHRQLIIHLRISGTSEDLALYRRSRRSRDLDFTGSFGGTQESEHCVDTKMWIHI
ncbi:unnamed protein product [Caretta caretta]